MVQALWFGNQSRLYQNECLKKILIPFLQKHLADGQYVFWPDKASLHYAKEKHNRSWIPIRSHLYPKTTTGQICLSVAQSKISSGFWAPRCTKIIGEPRIANSWLVESRDAFAKLTWRPYNAPVPISNGSFAEHPITDRFQMFTNFFSTMDNVSLISINQIFLKYVCLFLSAWERNSKILVATR